MAPILAPILAPIGGNVNFNIPENIKRGCRKTPQPLLIIMFFLVPGAGIEPARSQTSRDFKSYVYGFYGVLWSFCKHYILDKSNG